MATSMKQLPYSKMTEDNSAQRSVEYLCNAFQFAVRATKDLEHKVAFIRGNIRGMKDNFTVQVWEWLHRPYKAVTTAHFQVSTKTVKQL